MHKLSFVWSCMIIGLLLFGNPVSAQQTYTFSEGLIAGPCHHYGREALYTDQLTYLLFRNELKTPAAGQTVLTDKDGKPVTWQAIKTDQESKFKAGLAQDGYLYLTYTANEAKTAILNVSGHSMLYFNGAPHGGDAYASGWMYIPIVLKKGLNEILVRTASFSRYQGITAKLTFPDKAVALSTEDMTLPHIVHGKTNDQLWGAMVVVNTTALPLKDLQIKTSLQGKEYTTILPVVPALTTRKVGFRINATGIQQKGEYPVKVNLQAKGKVWDEKEIKLTATGAGEQYIQTFTSKIDGSIQYYAVAPQAQPDGKAPALFLSVHGAGVEAIGQARAYEPKNWGVLVAPTNRRPRGFNWEDWGRLDALEVFGMAKQEFKPDPEHIYLTGHSMGGHGTWYLGATFPGNWAAIAPCAGYPVLSAYGSHDGKIPESGTTPMENLLLRASNPSNVISLASNYKALGIYVLHGDADPVVSVDYARQMRKLLGTFHADHSYYEYPGGSHWYGNESVDWKPIFDFFKWHKIPADSAANVIDFTTANPAISATMRWATIVQQNQALKYSRIQLQRNKASHKISGVTENIALLKLDLADFKQGDTVHITLDSLPVIHHIVKQSNEQLYLSKGASWTKAEAIKTIQKGPHRNGTFKEPFNNQMVFVYATGGTAPENEWAYNKARYDAETWYYRGNGAVDVISDKEFDLKKYKDRGVIIYGNASTNKAWKPLLSDCPIQLSNGVAKLGDKEQKGTDIGAYFSWPRPDSPIASVAVIGGTGLAGMRASEANQYFSGGSGFPDFMIFTTDMLKEGIKGVKMAGFFGNDWSLKNGEIINQ
ncbi:carboxylesterase family protein [Xanthocytophaga flava]|uniref:carboxylesterase family protein n=1 Tax=Xanthocytophaga flava TaxID=3048013 RepID=UPI0028D711BC|nr:alpha/beta hydrolase-fold protein [Xanthocytophaga flavus]MDJ1469138.1 alpha/beta hydrolase-fold protein [Xanthocytophaga flavus]